MSYTMDAEIEATRLERQVDQANYRLGDEFDCFRVSPTECVLDAGCGSGVLCRYLLRERGVRQIHGIDSSSVRLDQARRLLLARERDAITFFEADLSSLEPRFRQQYDTAIARYVLEHVPDALAVLRELHEALKQGGRLIAVDLDGVFVNLSTPNAALRDYLDELVDKVDFDLFVGRKLPWLMREAGFVDVEYETRLIDCRGASRREEAENTRMRFAALGPFLRKLFGSDQRSEQFQRLYLKELEKPENTLVFTKFIGVGRKG